LPSLRFALETAVADLAARRSELPLARWLLESATAHVDVNGLLDCSGGVDVGERARALRAAGFTTIKVKVGVGAVDEDIRRVTALREAVPDAQIRIDVNAAWDEAKAREALTAMSSLNLEFVEQPLAVGNILPALRLARDAGVPLALDEEIETPADAIALIEEQMCDVLVLKPMVLGGISACLEIIAAAQRRGIGIVFTSSWESDIGIAATLHLAAAAGPVSRAAGLSTAGAIADGIIERPLVIESGRLLIPEAPGLGFSLVTRTKR
ncbi:MAG TPA: enolase C-terminal domain-like protein, partial [Acidobacteriota bacterium]|nr:enolase C-terminal domain-like protein [Acidobacteriota bacterium]